MKLRVVVRGKFVLPPKYLSVKIGRKHDVIGGENGNEIGHQVILFRSVGRESRKMEGSRVSFTSPLRYNLLSSGFGLAFEIAELMRFFIRAKLKERSRFT